MQIIGSVVNQLQTQNSNILDEFKKITGNPIITLAVNPINRNLVDMVFDILNSQQFKQEQSDLNNVKDVDIIVDSLGGDADAAYHIAKLLDSHFKGEIRYIIPRFAKSAATLLVCGGNKIIMGDTSELGPLDPQIPQEDGTYISAKAVQSTLELIKHQLAKKEENGIELATILASRINPLTLGQYESTLHIAKQYQTELLKLRMFRKPGDVSNIVNKFAEGYTHHSRVIGYKEAQSIFGKTKIDYRNSDDKEWQLIWKSYEVNRSIADLLNAQRIVDKFNGRI